MTDLTNGAKVMIAADADVMAGTSSLATADVARLALARAVARWMHGEGG